MDFKKTHVIGLSSWQKRRTQGGNFNKVPKQYLNLPETVRMLPFLVTLNMVQNIFPDHLIYHCFQISNGCDISGQVCVHLPNIVTYPHT